MIPPCCDIGYILPKFYKEKIIIHFKRKQSLNKIFQQENTNMTCGPDMEKEAKSMIYEANSLLLPTTVAYEWWFIFGHIDTIYGDF